MTRGRVTLPAELGQNVQDGPVGVHLGFLVAVLVSVLQQSIAVETHLRELRLEQVEPVFEFCVAQNVHELRPFESGFDRTTQRYGSTPPSGDGYRYG